MDKKSERKWRLRQFRLRSTIFFRKNGLYITAFCCLALLGAAAAVIFSGDRGAPSPVGRSDDERLADVTVTTHAAVTSAPTPNSSSRPASPAPRTESPYTALLPTPPANATPAPSAVIIPDFTPAPEETPDPMLSKLQPPVDGSVIRVFAMNSLIYSETLKQWMVHPGVDIAAKKGDAVYAVLAGKVEKVYTDDMLGVTVVIKHENGLTSVYSSLAEKPEVEQGASVAARQVIGHIGDTAIAECAERSHLHFELHHNGAPIDPESMIVFNKKQ